MAIDKVFLESLGKRIDELRKKKGISFQELADMSEVEKANLVRLTTKGKNITVNTLFKISKALGISLKELFDFEILSEDKYL